MQNVDLKNNRSTKPLIDYFCFSEISKLLRKCIFLCGRSEQAKLDSTSGNIGTTLSTKYTEVAR
jgi:hypothetical protein